MALCERWPFGAAPLDANAAIGSTPPPSAGHGVSLGKKIGGARRCTTIRSSSASPPPTPSPAEKTGAHLRPR
eukprot:7178897-Pyramimonas_sp.AAC.1